MTNSENVHVVFFGQSYLKPFTVGELYCQVDDEKWGRYLENLRTKFSDGEGIGFYTSYDAMVEAGQYPSGGSTAIRYIFVNDEECDRLETLDVEAHMKEIDEAIFNADPKRLWLITSPKPDNAGEYDEAVVVSGSAERARNIHPDGDPTPTDQRDPDAADFDLWVTLEDVTAVELGLLNNKTFKEGDVVCSSTVEVEGFTI